MAPPILIPEGEAAQDGATYASATSVVRAADMIAIQIDRDIKLDVQTTTGSRKIDIPKGTYGYLVRNATARGMYRVQLFDPVGRRETFTIPDGCFTRGNQHAAFHVVMPTITASVAHAAIGHTRSNDPVGKVVTQLWLSFADNKNLLHRLGFCDIQRLAGNPQELQHRIKTILGAFRPDAWAALNSEGLKLRRLLALKPVTDGYPAYLPGQQHIYIRLYFHGDRSTPNEADFAKYGGRTSQAPHTRNLAHNVAHADPRNRDNPHGRVARNFQSAKRLMFPIMTFNDTPSSDVIVAMAETTICCLLRTFHPAAFHQSPPNLSTDVRSGTHCNRLLLKAVVDITDQILRKVGFPRLMGRGTNWNLPMGDRMTDAREWVLHRATMPGGETMSVFRTMAQLRHRKSDSKKGGIGYKIVLYFQGFRLPSTPITRCLFTLVLGIDTIAETHSLPHGWPIILSVEILDSGASHPRSWSRLPLVGAFDNYTELSSFAIKVEFYSPVQQKWFSQFLRCNHILKPYNPGLSTSKSKKFTLDPLLKQFRPDSNILATWRTATTILQTFKNRRYRNNPIYLLHHVQANIKEVVYDHMAQAVTFRPLPVIDIDPPNRMSFKDNFDLTYKMTQDRWGELKIGVRPSAEWFVTGSPMDPKVASALPGCLLCRCQLHHSGMTTVKNCAARSSFPIADTEAHKDQIMSMSCGSCWKFFRSPCIWVPQRLVLVIPRDDENWSHKCQLDPKYNGATYHIQREFPPQEIAAPMSLEDYLGKADAVQEQDDESEDEAGEGEDD